MANTLSAKKRVRQIARRTERNKLVRSRTRTYEKQAREALASGDLEAAQKAVDQAVRHLDRAAAKGILHRNNAARRKGNLMKRLNAAEKAN